MKIGNIEMFNDLYDLEMSKMVNDDIWPDVDDINALYALHRAGFQQICLFDFSISLRAIVIGLRGRILFWEF